MKKFKFTLEAQLKLKKLAEQKRMAELAQVSGQVSRLQGQIDFFHSRTRELLNEESKKMNQNKFDIHFHQDMQLFFTRMRQNSEFAEKKIEELRPELEKRQAALRDARKNRRLLEVLKEKQLEEHRKEVIREEIKELDEFNNRPRYEVEL